HRVEHVHRHEPDTTLQQPPCEQAALTERVPSVAVTQRFIFNGDIERTLGLRREDPSERMVVSGVALSRLLALFQFAMRIVHGLQQLMAALEAGWIDALRRRQVRYSKVRRCRVRVQDERIKLT